MPDIDDLPNFEFFLVNDAVMKVWIPEKLSARLEWLSQALGSSRPDIVRGLLFEHVYGRVAMHRLQAFARQREQEANRLPRHASTEGGAKFSPPRNVDIGMLGKASDDFKLFLPAKLKEAISTLAGAHRLTPSHYVRKALVLEVMGERFHTEWQTAVGQLGNPSPDLDRLERE
jgi:hypothetical protein